MIHLKTLLLIILIFSFTTVELLASGHNRAGTSAAPELRIPVGARYLAMGGSQIASVEGLESIYWNPAGLDFSPSNANAIFSYRSYIAGMNVDFVAVSGRLGGLGTFGVAFRSLNIGTINITTMDQPDGTGGTMNPTYFVVGLTYSKRLTERISIGVNFNIISESFDRASAYGSSFDAGVQYRNLFNVPGLAIGIVIKNLGGSMKYGGNALFKTATDPNAQVGPTFYKFDASSAELPSEFSLGVSYLKKIDDQNQITVSTAFQNNNFTYDNYKLGFEYSFKNMFYLRGGYLFSPQATNDTPNIFENYTLGAGFNLKDVTGINLSIDYAFVPVKYFDNNNVFSVRYGL